MPNVERNESVSSKNSASYQIGSRPWRIMPLALVAVVATTVVAGAAMQVFRDLSGDRYAFELLRDRLAKSVPEELRPH